VRVSEVAQIAVGRGELEVEDLPATDLGAGRAPLVFLHEGLGSRSLWRDFPGAVHAATGRRTIVWSRHGYGRSAVVDEPREVTYMHDEAREVLPELLARLAIEDPVLVGHSDGGSIALIHAGTPGLPPVSGLVLLAPHVVVEDESRAGLQHARETFLATDLEERMGRHHRDPASTFWGWNDIWLSPAFRAWDITDVLPHVDCPVLAVQGADDQYGTFHQLDLIEGAVAGPTTRVHLADCGHAPHLEQPERTRRATVDFLATLP
jgi:pimeloyl-ACP methyl ester carboxylesterase